MDSKWHGVGRDEPAVDGRRRRIASGEGRYGGDVGSFEARGSLDEGGVWGGGVGGGAVRPSRPLRMMPARFRVQATTPDVMVAAAFVESLLAKIMDSALLPRGDMNEERWCLTVAGLARILFPSENRRAEWYGVGTPRIVRSCASPPPTPSSPFPQ